MKTATKQTDKKTDYLDNKLIPAILQADKRIELDNKGGSLVLPLDSDKGIVVNGSVWFLAYVTPFWEGSNGIPIDVGNDDGSYAEGKTVPYRNCYFWGHGSPSAIGGINPASVATKYDIQKAAGNFLNTAKPQNFHPYRFVFIDGCSTGKGNFCESFGIPAQTVNNQYFANVGVESRAFLGFKSPKNFSPTQWTWYALMIGGFYADWQSGQNTVQQCVANAVNGVHNYGEVTMDSSWVIYGAPDLQINTITRP